MKGEGSERSCNTKPSVFQLAGKEVGEGQEGGRRRNWTLDLCYRHFHSSAVSHCCGSQAADTPVREQLLHPAGELLFDYSGPSFSLLKKFW